MTVLASIKPTKRILRIECPLCDAPLEVEVEGLPMTVLADEWLEQLSFADEEKLHIDHERQQGGEILSSRARTRRLTEPQKGES